MVPNKNGLKSTTELSWEVDFWCINGDLLVIYVCEFISPNVVFLEKVSKEGSCQVYMAS